MAISTVVGLDRVLLVTVRRGDHDPVGVTERVLAEPGRPATNVTPALTSLAWMSGDWASGQPLDPLVHRRGVDA